MSDQSHGLRDAPPLLGKVAVISGASGGIGAAAARMLAHDGASVVVGYKGGEDRARRVVAELPGNTHVALQLALEDSQSVVRFAADVSEEYGRADILVNSAGFTVPVPHANLDALTDELMDSMLIANVRGTFSVIRAFAPMLKASGDGVVINVSSISAFTGSGSSIAYCACKAALDTMTMSLARAMGPSVRVLCVSPGAVATDFVAGRDRAALEKISAATPLKQVVEPEDVATAIMACVALKKSTGSKIIVDGGRFLV
ncbi:MAG: short-chain dehydrogenase [Xanthobacteraceae bacterium]|nr:short-chain dehydrogenase [Xanthobacteraceae bacterium]